MLEDRFCGALTKAVKVFSFGAAENVGKEVRTCVGYHAVVHSWRQSQTYLVDGLSCGKALSYYLLGISITLRIGSSSSLMCASPLCSMS